MSPVFASAKHFAPMMPNPPHKSSKRIAIVGGGISGISCLWGLQNEDYEVHLYEADGRLGGHANSVPFVGNGKMVSVDTGFIAMNEEMYREPYFSSLVWHYQAIPQC